jgi:hypothetical protein
MPPKTLKNAKTVAFHKQINIIASYFGCNNFFVRSLNLAKEFITVRENTFFDLFNKIL